MGCFHPGGDEIGDYFRYRGGRVESCPISRMKKGSKKEGLVRGPKEKKEDPGSLN